MSYLESLHPHSKVTVERLVEIHAAGRDATRGFLRELDQCGYVNKRRVRVSGRFDYEITVYGSPDLNKTPENDRIRKSVSGENISESPSTDLPSTAHRDTVDHSAAHRLPETRHIKDLNTKKLKIEELEDQRLAFVPIDEIDLNEEEHTQDRSGRP